MLCRMADGAAQDVERTARPIVARTTGDGTSNEDLELTPAHVVGPEVLEFDFPDVEVGTAEYLEGPTGCTVVHAPRGARTFVDVRGGSPGYIGYPLNHAVCFAGGSVYGIEAVAGVLAELRSLRGNTVGWDELPLVSGAVIYDFTPRENTIYPDKELGRAALRNARAGVCPLGRVGAGISATAGKALRERAEYTGQGAAYREVGDAKLFVCTVVNPIGVVVDRAGNVVRGNYDSGTRSRRPLVADYEEALAAPSAAVSTPPGNTTLTVLVTNLRLSDFQLEQLARLVHSSMHRAIQPFHTEKDGDVLFAMTTDDVGAEEIDTAGFAVLASELTWDAVLASSR
jgi:L-aminopeptidase/D-esterase-like protein